MTEILSVTEPHKESDTISLNWKKSFQCKDLSEKLICINNIRKALECETESISKEFSKLANIHRFE